MKNILLVGEDTSLLFSLRKLLKPYFDTIKVASFYEGEAHILIHSLFADLVCIDTDSIMGFSFNYFKKVSKKGSKKLLFLVSFRQLEELESIIDIPGADYVLKPYHPSEIIVRMKRLLAEPVHTLMTVQNHIEIVPGLLFDEVGSALIINGKRKSLSRTLKNMLAILTEHKNRVVSHDHFYEKIWGDYCETETQRDIRAHIRRLRRLLGNEYSDIVINVKAQGYMLKSNTVTLQ